MMAGYCPKGELCFPQRASVNGKNLLPQGSKFLSLERLPVRMGEWISSIWKKVPSM